MNDLESDKFFLYYYNYSKVYIDSNILYVNYIYIYL